MTTTDTHIPEFPHVTAIFHPHAVEVTLLGVSRMFEGDPTVARADALEYLWTVAKGPDFNRPLRVHTKGEFVDGTVALIVTPQGRYYDESDPETTWAIDTEDDSQLGSTDLKTAGLEAHEADSVGVEPEPAPSVPAATPAAVAAPVAPEEHRTSDVLAGPGVPRHHQRKSFIAVEPIVRPARRGWRGTLNRLGARLEPGTIERAWRDDVSEVSQHWPGARTIAIANQKGGSGKTPSTVLLSAILARHGGAGVLAWDNNETEGTLGMRTQTANHESTVLDMLPHTDQLLSPSASAADLARYTHHQPADKYDVLHSDTSLLGEHEMTAADVYSIHRVASRYYRMIVMDSGNNRKAGNWLAMIDHADSLVIPCTDVEDSPEVGARILDALHERDERSARLAASAVAIVSQKTDSKAGKASVERIADNFRSIVRDVVTIPYDPALVSGIIHLDSLRPATQRAWLKAAAAVAKGL